MLCSVINALRNLKMEQDTDKYGNSENVELAWAYKAYEQAEIHFNVITTVDPSYLKLSTHDNEIYQEFRKMFPNFNVEHLSEDEIKTESAKKKWREFCNKFGDMRDFNFGTLLRIDPFLTYTDENTMFATRIQFLAIEIARNREGLTKKLYNQYLSKRKPESSNNVQLTDVAKNDVPDS